MPSSDTQFKSGHEFSKGTRRRRAFCEDLSLKYLEEHGEEAFKKMIELIRLPVTSTTKLAAVTKALELFFKYVFLAPKDTESNESNSLASVLGRYNLSSHDMAIFEEKLKERAMQLVQSIGEEFVAEKKSQEATT